VLPIVLNRSAVKVGLAGQGEALERRQASLAEAGIEPITVSSDDDPSALTVLYIAGFSRAQSADLARKAKAVGVLVNVEDVPELCDFHAPATVRRGDLLVTISTGGRAPGLAKLIREWISARLGSEWGSHLDVVSRRRATWRAEGLSPNDVSRRARDVVGERNWLA